MHVLTLKQYILLKEEDGRAFLQDILYSHVFSLEKTPHMIKLLQGLVSDHVSGSRYRQEMVYFAGKN